MAFVVATKALGCKFLTKGQQALRKTLVGRDQILQFKVDRGEGFRGMRRALSQAFRFAAQIIDLRLARDGLVLQMGGTTHHFEMVRFVARRLLLHLSKLALRRSQFRFEAV